MKTKRNRLAQRLVKAFLVQAAAIGVLVVVGVLGAGYVIKDVLMRQALENEAHYFWENRLTSPDFPLPDTLNLTGFLVVDNDESELPEPLQFLQEGYHSLTIDPKPDPELPQVKHGHGEKIFQDQYALAYVESHHGNKLVLAFDAKQINRLTFYFGLVPLIIVLAGLYLLSFFGYTMSHRAISPVIALARKVENLDPAHPDPKAFSPDTLPGNVDHEVAALYDALDTFALRLDAFVDRETHLTRDTSHELRSPLTVIKLAADMLETEQELSKPARTSVQRIKNAVADMQELTNAFLLLARETDQPLDGEDVNVNEVVSEEVERARITIANKPITLDTRLEHPLAVRAPHKALAIVVGNLIRNACTYTDTGSVTVSTADNQLTVADSGKGIENVDKIFDPYYRGVRQRGGYGVGLTIVKRFCERFNWVISIQSEVGKGTEVTLTFPAAMQA